MAIPQPKTSKQVQQGPSTEEELEDVCLICHGAGVVHPVEDGRVDYSQVVTCDCMKDTVLKQRRDMLIKMCELPAGTTNWTFENFKTDNRWPSLKEAKDAAIAIADEKDDTRWLSLLSRADRGKSHLAVAICRRWLERGRPARYILVPMMLDELRRGYSKEGEDSYDLKLQFIMNVDLLILDDIGAQVPTPWAMEKLMMIIDHRSVNDLPLVVTTNKELKKLPGDDEHRIGSRLLRFEASRHITIEAPEYRTWRK